jgi:hypothetical protein
MEKTTGLTFIFILAYFAAILFIFLPAMEGDFLWDDKLFISENPNILGNTFLRSFLISPFGGHTGFLAYKNKPEEGKKIVTDMLRLFPQNHQVLIHAARFYMILKDNNRAIELLHKDYNLFRNSGTLKLLEQLENPPQRP